MGNKVKPHAMKVLQGTDRPDRETKPSVEFPVPDIVEPPDWLTGPDAVNEWRRVVALLHPVRVLTEADLSNLGHMCNLHGAMVREYRAGITPQAAHYTQLRIMSTEFGLTPASRHKVAAAGGAEKSNRFGALKKPA